MHYGCCSFLELIVLLNQVPFKTLFFEFVKWQFWSGCLNYQCFAFPCLCKEDIVMSNLMSPERRTGLECLSGNGKFLNQTRALRWKGCPLDYFHYYSRNLGGKKITGWFPEQRVIGAGVCSWSWLYCSTRKLPNSCLWMFWNGHFALVVQTNNVLLFLVLKGRISHAKSCFSVKEITFGVPFKRW